MQKPCVFFDRDGIVNVSPGPGYVERVADLHIMPEFMESLRVVIAHGYAAAIITNQRGVGLGIMTEDTLQDIHNRLREKVIAAGLSLLDIVCCTATENSDPRRKPNPGMILETAAVHHLDLSRSWMIGDNEKDVQAGHAAGCRCIRVAPPDKETAAEHHIATMAHLPNLLANIL